MLLCGRYMKCGYLKSFIDFVTESSLPGKGIGRMLVRTKTRLRGLRAVPIFPLELRHRKRRRAETGSRKNLRGRANFRAPAFAMSFPRLDELERKNRDCS